MKNTHGYLHAARVCVLVARMCQDSGISPAEAYALMLAAVVHDAGRVNNGTDARHGERAAAVCLEYGIPLPEHIKEIVAYHSRGDRTYARHPLRRLIDVLKDADALDRVRSGDLDPRCLRGEHSLALIAFALDLLGVVAD